MKTVNIGVAMSNIASAKIRAERVHFAAADTGRQAIPNKVKQLVQRGSPANRYIVRFTPTGLAMCGE